MSKVYIFCGHLGSGKTETSINFSRSLNKKVYLCDLDFVNPYYRSREKKSELLKDNVIVISSNKLTEYADIPGLSSEVSNVIMRKETDVVLDIGGDDKGARVLGSLKKSIEKSDYEMFLVVNPYRPETSGNKGIREIAEQIQNVSSLKFNSIFYNPNLTYSTTFQDVKNAFDRINEYKYLPISYFVVDEKIFNENIEYFDKIQNSEINILKISRFMNNPWEL